MWPVESQNGKGHFKDIREAFLLMPMYKSFEVTHGSSSESSWSLISRFSHSVSGWIEAAIWGESWLAALMKSTGCAAKGSKLLEFDAFLSLYNLIYRFKWVSMSKMAIDKNGL